MTLLPLPDEYNAAPTAFTPADTPAEVQHKGNTLKQ